MPAISLGLGEVEERLQQIRRRLNSLSLQHAVYLGATLLALLGALLVVLALRAPPRVFGLSLAGYLVLACAVGGFAAWRVRARWLSLEGVARHADRQAALDSRLATLCAQRSRSQRSRLGGILLAQTLAMGPRWDRSTLAPRRVPWSVYPLLLSLMLFGAAWFVPPGPVEFSTAEDHSPSKSSALQPEETVPDQSANAGNLPMTGSGQSGDGSDGSGTRMAARQGGPPQNGNEGSEIGTFDESSKGGEAGKGVARLADANKGRSSGPTDGGEHRGDDLANDDLTNTEGANAWNGRREGEHPDKGTSPHEQLAMAGDKSRPDRPSEQERNEAKVRREARPAAANQTDSSNAKGGAKASGQIGGKVTDSLFENTEAPAERSGEGGSPATFALRLTGVSASSPTDFEPQNKKPAGVPGVTVGQGSQGNQELVDQQIDDDPLQRAQVDPEHETLVQRIFRHD